MHTHRRIVRNWSLLPAPTRRSSGTKRTDGHLLLEQVAAGDRVAFSALYDAFASATYAICLTHMKDAAAADTAMIQTWIFIWTHATALNTQPGSTRFIVLSSARAVARPRRKTPQI